MGKEIGIDLGTANVLIHMHGRGIVLNEPSVVAIDKQSDEIIAVGHEAYEMIGRNPKSIEVIHPLRGGVIADFDITEAMLVILLEKIQKNSWFSKPNVLISCPSNVSEVERTSLIEAVERSVGGRIYIEEEAKIAGIGAGIDIQDNTGSMVIDIGGGTTDIAVITSGEIIASESLKVAGDDFNDAIVQYLKREFHLLVGERSAEQLKIAVSTAQRLENSEVRTFDIKGRDLITGLPKSLNIHSNQVYDAILPNLRLIARAAQAVLESVSPEIASDIIEKGIILTGGGALIKQLDNYLTEFLNVSVIQADQPMQCVAIGSGLMLEMILSGKVERNVPSRVTKVRRWLMRMKRRLLG